MNVNMQAFRRRASAFVVGAALLAFSGWAAADPPSRVARLGYTSGAVSFSPAGEDDWFDATTNRPLGTGDRLWTDARARAEIQVGGATIRMDEETSVSVLNLDDRITQLQLTQGRLNVRVRRLEREQVFEVDTPNLAFVLRQPGEYRIEVDPRDDATIIVVRQGRGEVYGEDASYVVDARQPYRFSGTDLREYQMVDLPRLDEFDRWARDRDRAFDNSVSARYVSPDVLGYQDLDAHGTWRSHADYGHVWYPSRVADGWAPYRDGHWAWVDPWGWTWVDDAPWGFAVSHYGRWANLGGTWGWVPGPVRTRAYYAPALVVFVGGDNFQLTISTGNVGGVGWFPLGPREVYRPSYAVSRGYFENVNRSNTVVNNTVINNVYNNINVTNIVYANRQVPGAVVAVPTSTFVQSQPVSRAAVKVSREVIADRPLSVAAPVAPVEKSVHGPAAQRDKPPARVFERPVVARTAPPEARAGFAAQKPQLSAKPGTPLDDDARKALKPSPAAPAPVVKLVKPAAAPTLIAAPRATVAAPDPAASVAPARGAAPRSSTAQAPDQPGKPEARGKPEQRQRPVEEAPPPPPPQIAPSGATAQPPRPQRPATSKADAKAESRAREPGPAEPEQRQRPVEDAPPPPPPQIAPSGATAQPPRPQRPATSKADAKAESRAREPGPAEREQRQRPVEDAPPPPPPQTAPSGAAAQPPRPQRPPASKAESRTREPVPAASEPVGRKKDREDRRLDEEDRKPPG